MTDIASGQHEYVREWIDALRSEKYNQTSGKLAIGDSYCCLGVLCELNRERLNLRWVEEEDCRVITWLVDDISYQEGGTLPLPVSRIFDNDRDPDMLIPPKYYKIVMDSDNSHSEDLVYLVERRFDASELNDTYHFSFAMIADCLEFTFFPEAYND